MVCNSADNCSTCALSVPTDMDDMLECRSGPPTVLPKDEGFVSVFPLVSSEEWCGDYIPEDEEDDGEYADEEDDDRGIAAMED